MIHTSRLLPLTTTTTFRSYSTHKPFKLKMGKNNKRPPSSTAPESHLLLPNHITTNSRTPIIDTHTHIHLTYAAYLRAYPTNPKFQDLYAFVRGMYEGRNVEAVVDVWCEAPVCKVWKELADSALTAEGRMEKWGGVEYWFVMGECLSPLLL
jgi:TatD DNase family protein